MAAAGFAACMGGSCPFLPLRLSPKNDQTSCLPSTTEDHPPSCGNWYRAHPRADVRPDRRARTGPMYCAPFSSPQPPQPALNPFVIRPTQERNSLGAVKAVTAAQLAMATDAVHSVTLDDAIEAMRLTAAGT